MSEAHYFSKQQMTEVHIIHKLMRGNVEWHCYYSYEVYNGISDCGGEGGTAMGLDLA